MFGRDLTAMLAAANLQVASLASLPLPDVATLAPGGLPHGRHGLKLNQAAALDLLAQFTQRP
jgi:hypothetical protein